MTTRKATVPFTLIRTSPAVSEADGTANVKSDIFKAQVPRGERWSLRPGSTFQAYLEDASAEIGNGGNAIEIQVRDASEQQRLTVYGPAPYISSKESQDIDLKAKLNVPEVVYIPERGWIVITVKDDGAIDASDSRFQLDVHREPLELT